MNKNWPYFEDDEITATLNVLKSGKVNYWTGTEGKKFEEEFAHYCETKHAIALANGTVALELALISLGIGKGDEVIVPSRTFFATASCVVKCGAIPVVADIDPTSQNITADTIEAVLTPKTKCVIVVHLAGWPCDMDSIYNLSQKHDFKIVEDCAQALGGKYDGKPVGSLSDVAAFSFCQDKIMTTGGEGGMLVTNDTKIWEKAWAYKDHGKNYQKVSEPNPESVFRWVHDSFGSNYRMTEVQAAIGRVALKKVNNWVRIRRSNADIYYNELKNHPILKTNNPPSKYYHAYYKFYCFLRADKLRTGWSRNKIVSEIRKTNVPCFSGSCSEIYREKAFEFNNLAPNKRFINAKLLGETSIMFLTDPTFTTEDIHDNCIKINSVLNKALKDLVSSNHTK